MNYTIITGNYKCAEAHIRHGDALFSSEMTIHAKNATNAEGNLTPIT